MKLTKKFDKMDFKKIEIPETKGTSWKWPVKIGVSQIDPASIGEPRHPYHTLTSISKVQTLDDSKKKAFHQHILLFDNFEQALAALEKNNGVTADIIIIQVPEGFSNDHPDWKKIDSLSQKWTQRTQAVGLYIIKDTLQNEGLLSEIVTGLLNPKGVDETISSLNVIVRSYVAPNQDEITKLSPKARTRGRKAIGFEINRDGGHRGTSKGMIDVPEELSGAYEEAESASFESEEAATSMPPPAPESGAMPSAAEMAPVAPPDQPSPPRYLRAAVINREDQQLVEQFLLPANLYQLSIGIGEHEAGWTSVKEELEVKEFFKDPTLKKIDIDLTIQLNTHPKPVYKRLVLPREGKSSVTTLDFSTDDIQDIFEADISAYYGNRLLQQVKYRIAVKVPGAVPVISAPELNLVIVLRQNLTNLSDQEDISASLKLVQTETTEACKDTEVTGRHAGAPVQFAFNSALQKMVDNVKELLETGALYQDQTHLENRKNINLLINLANQGYLLHTNYLNEITLNGPLQLVSNFKEYLPLDFAYTYKPPENDAVLCKDAKASLEKGKCCGCLDHDIDKQYKTVCPFGFWGLRHVVERHQLPKDTNQKDSAFVLRFDPDAGRNTLHILNKTLYASTDRVNAKVSDSYDALKKQLNANAAQSPIEVKSWTNWREQIMYVQPDTLVLIVHVEIDSHRRINKLEIAHEDYLEQPQFDERYLQCGNSSPLPLVILIGCETTQTDAYMFDTVSFIQRKGAAIVLSNFMKIRGSTATEIVGVLVSMLRENEGREIRFGEIILALKQKLLAKGMMFGLTLLAHGDADWKIKT